MSLGAPGSSDRGARGTPAIDRSVLGEWLADDDAAIDELLIVFRDSIRAEIINMREVLADGRLDAFADAAHRLRGAALSMGARALAEFVGLLFTAARAQDGVACANGMPILETHVQLVAAEVPDGL
jgi:HPt (histidine-containing phosphotransfer) domain-containing protein